MKMINSKEENIHKSLLRNKVKKILKKKKKRIWAEVISLYPCETCIIFIDIRKSCYLVVLDKYCNRGPGYIKKKKS